MGSLYIIRILLFRVLSEGPLFSETRSWGFGDSGLDLNGLGLFASASDQGPAQKLQPYVLNPRRPVGIGLWDRI